MMDDFDYIVEDMPLVALTPRMIELLNDYTLDDSCLPHITDGSVISRHPDGEMKDLWVSYMEIG
jgi:hypothetical protein